MSDATELAAGVRRLRPAVRGWLARDLSGPPGEHTWAYVDLMFAHASARLGAADAARRLAVGASAALAAGRPAAPDVDPRALALVLRSLPALFRHRIDEALAGRPPRRNWPGGLLPAAAGPDDRAGQLAGYVVSRARSQLRVLESSPADPYLWLAPDPWSQVGELWADPHRPDLEGRLGERLAAADRARPVERVRVWKYLLPLADLTSDGFRAGLLFRVPGVVADVLPAGTVDPTFETVDTDLPAPARLVAEAVRQAAAMPHPEVFPPLVDAALAVTSAAGPTAARVLAEVGGECLGWFRRVGAADEAEMFLYRARELWPAGGLDRPEDARAAAVRSGLLRVAGRRAEADNRLEAVAAALDRAQNPGPWWWPSRGVVGVAVGYAAAASTDRAGVGRLGDVLPLLRPRPDNSTTRGYYSRWHLEVVDALLSAFPGVAGVGRPRGGLSVSSG